MKTTVFLSAWISVIAGLAWSVNSAGEEATLTNARAHVPAGNMNREARVAEMAWAACRSVKAELEHVKRQMASDEATVERVSRSNTIAIARLEAEMGEHRDIMALRLAATDGRVEAIEERTAENEKSGSMLFVWIVAALVVAAVAAFMIAIVYFRRRDKVLVEPSHVRLDAKETESGAMAPASGPALVAESTYSGCESEVVKQMESAPAAGRLAQLSTSDAIVDALIKRTSCWSEFWMRVTRCSPFFRVGIATTQGHVREENQDTVVSFGMGAVQAVVKADGMGGCDNGRLGSFVGVSGAANCIVDGLLAGRGDIERIPRDAIYAACRALGEEAEERKVGGLRTTMLVVLATPERYYWAAVGDTVGVVVRKAGGIDRFFAVQRLDSGPSNVVTGSLGPAMAGNVLSGSIPAHPLDVIVCATDGVHDRAPAGFERTLAEGAMDLRCNLQEMVETVLKGMADAHDGAGFVCDDNLSLSVLVSSIGRTTHEYGNHSN